MENVTLIKSKFLKNLFDQNTYVVSNKKEAIIIDAGAELEDVKNAVGNKKVLAVFITHLHFDHFWNLDEYLACFKCPVYIQKGFYRKFTDSNLNASYVIKMNFQKNIPEINVKYYAKKLSIGDFNIEIIETPGHSKDCVCILIGDNLFTGDTVFIDSIGRTDLVDSDNNEIVESIKTIKQLDYKTAYPGHYDIVSKEQIDKTISFYL